jgi:hypothetical protein
MNLGTVILKTSIQNLSDENFHFYNSLVLTHDLAFQRTYFRITPPNIPRLYQHYPASNEQDDLPIQNRLNLQNNKLLKIAVLIATNACAKETSHAIIDSGASCCVIPYIEDLIHQPTPIQKKTLEGISGGITALGRGSVQLRINQENIITHPLQQKKPLQHYSTGEIRSYTITILKQKYLHFPV